MWTKIYTLFCLFVVEVKGPAQALTWYTKAHFTYCQALAPNPLVPQLRGLGLTLISGGQREEGHGVVHHFQ